MFIDTGVIKEELECEVNAGKGCIVIDISCIYNSQDSELRSLCILDYMVLRLLVDGKELEDCKLNHRYPNLILNLNFRRIKLKRKGL